MDRGWIDLGPATDYLAAKAEPGQDFLIDNSWPFIRRLYAEGKVRRPGRSYDTYRVAHHQLPKTICQVDWFVAAQGAGTWPAARPPQGRGLRDVQEGLRGASRSRTSDGTCSFVTWDGSVEIYRNTRPGSPG